MRTMRAALREQGTLAAALRRAQALAETLVQHKAPEGGRSLPPMSKSASSTARMER